ncbi:hypothetical protein B0T22DRAFT_471373 [Podospora appendiculata]|uniref:Uncharacterized protein n=1 Tax=Podospora appendiculata TaxID=314037 RepID=A0AAE1C8A0_9PEZI|nr:hypothetical protein B0T22DRAFT_471373 [Podospora appendiculata]
MVVDEDMKFHVLKLPRRACVETGRKRMVSRLFFFPLIRPFPMFFRQLATQGLQRMLAGQDKPQWYMEKVLGDLHGIPMIEGCLMDGFGVLHNQMFHDICPSIMCHEELSLETDGTPWLILARGNSKCRLMAWHACHSVAFSFDVTISRTASMWGGTCGISGDSGDCVPRNFNFNFNTDEDHTHKGATKQTKHGLCNTTKGKGLA